MKRHTEAREAPARSRFPLRCYAMAIAWAAIGLGVTWYSYDQRMLVIEPGKMSIVHNEQGMVAGYVAMAFGAFWLVVGIVSALRAKQTSPD